MATNIFIFIPAFGQIITSTTFLTTHQLCRTLQDKNVGTALATLSFPDIAELRSMAMTIWYDTMPDASHLLFIDADMGFAPDLVTDMLLFNEPLIGALYPQRKLPLSWAGSGTGEATAERRGNFMRVEGVGMGCTLIKREVVTKMIEAYPDLIDTRINLHPAFGTLTGAGCKRLLRFWEKLDIPERGLVSEDLSFCIRWNKIGGQTWASIGHRMSHVGQHDFAGRYLDVVEQGAAQAAEPVAPMTDEQLAAVSASQNMDLFG